MRSSPASRAEGLPINVICDVDGVVVLGDRGIPGSGDALRELEQRDVRILFVTNNSARSPSDVAVRIEQLAGYPASADQILTSAMAAARTIASDTGPCFVLGGSGINLALSEAGIATTSDPRDARYVVAGLATDLTYAWLRDAATAIFNGAVLIGTNRDPTYPTHDGEWPGGGAIVAALEKATGVEAIIAGKPHQPMIDLIEDAIAQSDKPGENSGETWVIGDRVDTDIALAWSGGWGSILVGDLRHAGDRAQTERPTASTLDLAEAVEWLLDPRERGGYDR